VYHKLSHDSGWCVPMTRSLQVFLLAFVVSAETSNTTLQATLLTITDEAAPLP
jgi:hypothetical protein